MRQDIVQTLWDFYIIHADLGASQYEEVLEQISTKYDRRREELAEILRVFSLQPMYTTHNTPAQQSQLPLRRQEDTRHMSLSDEASVLVALQGDVHGDIRLGDFESIRSLLGVYLRGIEDTCKKWSFSVILEPQETSLQFMNGIEQMYIPTEVTVLNAPEAILPSDSHYLTEAIAANQRLVLLGETGSGKSTALRYLAMVLCRAYQYVCFDKTEALDKHPHSRTNFKRDDPQPLLPMFLTAAKLAQELKKHKTLEPQDILSLLLRQHISDPERYPSFVDFMKEKVRNGRVLLLLDGLDEIADDRMFYRVQRLVYEFADVYQRCRILVSMRTSTQVRKRQRKVEGDSSYQEMPLYCWPTASIVSWSISRMECYIDIWHRLSSQPSQALGGSAHELKGLLATRLDLQQLAANPLLLAVLVIAHTKSKASVERKTAIYKRFLILLMDRWERLGKEASDYGPIVDYVGTSEETTTVEQFLHLLQKLAYRMKEASDKSGFLSHHEAVGIAAEHLDILKHENPYKGAVRFLRYTNERVGLLRSEGKGYTFAYSSFQEYLAGLEIVSSADPIPIITNLVHSAHWHTPILLGIRDITDSSLHMPYYLVSGLLSSSGDAQRNHQHIILAAEVMTILLDYTDPSQNEQERSLLEDLRYRVIAALDNLNTNTNLTLHDEHRRSIKIHLKKISEGKPNPKQSF